MKHRTALIVAALMIVISTTVLILRARRPAGDPGAAAGKPPASLSKPDAEPAAPPPPEREPRNGGPQEKGFYKCFRCLVPLPLDEATVRQRIREARKRWYINSPDLSPDTPMQSMEEAFQRVWDYSFAPLDIMPTWGVEDDDFYVFSGNRMEDGKLPPSKAFEYGMAVRKADGKLFLWMSPKPKSP